MNTAAWGFGRPCSWIPAFAGMTARAKGRIMQTPDYLDAAPDRRLAFRRRRGRGPTVVFLPGYMSDM